MDRADVIIFGGGLVGLALASALDSSGLSTILVDPADPAPRGGPPVDGRARRRPPGRRSTGGRAPSPRVLCGCFKLLASRPTWRRVVARSGASPWRMDC